MKYSNFIEDEIVYQTDENGNVKTITVDGVEVPIKKGVRSGYTEVQEFKAVITNKLAEIIIQEFGIDDSTNYAQITAKKGYLKLKKGGRVWKKSEVAYTDDETIDENSADYICKGVADEGIDFDLFLLQKIIK